ncbi:MAG: hypothetical protein MRZ79_03285 [Bacteroidia bacterium]|nr:hypothetical protein [Bacteroidia bacterium]
MYIKLMNDLLELAKHYPDYFSVEGLKIHFHGNLHRSKRVGLIVLSVFAAISLSLFVFMSIALFEEGGLQTSLLILAVGLMVNGFLFIPIIGKSGILDIENGEYCILLFGRMFRRIPLENVSKIHQTTQYYNGIYQGVSVDLIGKWGKRREMIRFKDQKIAREIATVAAFAMQKAKGLV